jgi:hypothetical protein
MIIATNTSSSLSTLWDYQIIFQDSITYAYPTLKIKNDVIHIFYYYNNIDTSLTNSYSNTWNYAVSVFGIGTSYWNGSVPTVPEGYPSNGFTRKIIDTLYIKSGNTREGKMILLNDGTPIVAYSQQNVFRICHPVPGDHPITGEWVCIDSGVAVGINICLVNDRPFISYC